MKKLVLLSLASGLMVTANAQYAQVNWLPKVATEKVSADKAPIKSNSNTASKGTVGGTRKYNYVEHRVLTNPDIINNGGLFNSLTPLRNVVSVFSNAVDTSAVGSFAVTLDPQYNQYNDPIFYPDGPILIDSTKPYTVDSVSFWAVYNRNPSKTDVVDTLIIKTTYGNGRTGSNLLNFRFNSEPNRLFPGISMDSIQHVMVAPDGGNAANIKTIKFPIPSNIKDNDDENGFTEFKIPVNMNVPAGNIAAASVTFINGENVPEFDTLFAYDGTALVHKYSSLRPYAYEFVDGAHANDEYPVGIRNFNYGYISILDDAGWGDMYIPNIAFTDPFGLEMPEFTWTVTCATCNGTSIKDVSNITSTNAVPNPANSEIKISFNLKAASNATVNVTNAIGQKVAQVELGKVNAGQNSTRINTSNLPNGVYFYTIEANGVTTSNRFVVSH